MFFAKFLSVALLGLFSFGNPQTPLDKFDAHPPVHVNKHFTAKPNSLLTPSQTKKAYNLSTDLTAGAGKTIAIIDAYDNPTIAADLNTFSQAYGLPVCDSTNPCFQKVKMVSNVRSNRGWALEEALDVQWAHAIAPGAKILLVEARSSSGNDLLKAVDYARAQAGVVSISMSWGGSEFSTESASDTHFTTANGSSIGFFASSGDNGTGVSWPAVSPNVVGVGGTTLTLKADGTISSETAWSGSGGGIASYESEPSYQTAFGVSSGSHRGVPDVSYNANPNTGFPVYDSYGYNGAAGWFQVGGTSAGAPQWAAINAVGGHVAGARLYSDATTLPADFLDITLGTNGTCGSVCTARTGYDFVTGLGSPATYSF
jgi:subtilase family serine protease